MALQMMLCNLEGEMCQKAFQFYAEENYCKSSPKILIPPFFPRLESLFPLRGPSSLRHTFFGQSYYRTDVSIILINSLMFSQLHLFQLLVFWPFFTPAYSFLKSIPGFTFKMNSFSGDKCLISNIC